MSNGQALKVREMVFLMPTVRSACDFAAYACRFCESVRNGRIVHLLNVPPREVEHLTTEAEWLDQIAEVA